MLRRVPRSQPRWMNGVRPNCPSCPNSPSQLSELSEQSVRTVRTIRTVRPNNPKMNPDSTGPLGPQGPMPDRTLRAPWVLGAQVGPFAPIKGRRVYGRCETSHSKCHTKESKVIRILGPRILGSYNSGDPKTLGSDPRILGS